jgi:hypothetical protein
MASETPRPLSLSDSFPCPICRQGHIEAIALTEAFACEFCRHIMSVDLPAQQVKVVDSSQPLTWLWNGQKWQLCRGEQAAELSAMVIIAALILILFPASVVWLSGAIFPPLTPNAQLSFSTIWSLITLLAHLAFVLWLIGEYYQIPLYIAAKLRVLRFRN